MGSIPITDVFYPTFYATLSYTFSHHQPILPYTVFFLLEWLLSILKTVILVDNYNRLARCDDGCGSILKPFDDCGQLCGLEALSSFSLAGLPAWQQGTYIDCLLVLLEYFAIDEIDPRYSCRASSQHSTILIPAPLCFFSLAFSNTFSLAFPAIFPLGWPIIAFLAVVYVRLRLRYDGDKAVHSI